MSNVFEELLSDVKSVEEKFIGPDYPYYKYVRSPSDIGMTGDGSLSALGKDIDGLKSYVEILVSGTGNASATGQPLGNKFFLKTLAKCSDITTGQDVDRYMYINNVPAGNIPFISSGLGTNFSELRGLIPGTMSNLNAFNPMAIFQSFVAGSKPQCQELMMETIDIYNNKSTESHFVTLIDIKNMDPCSFQNRTNPITNQGCKEAYTNQTQNSNTPNKFYKIPKDTASQFYFASLGVLSIYILYRLMEKNGMVPKSLK